MHILIPGQPRPKGRARSAGHHHYTPATTRAYERHVRACTLAAMASCAERFPEGDVSLTIALFFRDKRKRDVDNVAKAIMDGITRARLWTDDSQVRLLRVLRADPDAAEPRADVIVDRYDPHDDSHSILDGIMHAQGRSLARERE